MTYTANTLTLNTNLNVDPYYDDFDESKNFHRILFRPGFAVQGRELTQMQTMLQNQIDRFGEHVFKEGSIVSGLQLNYDNKLTYVKIKDVNSSNTSVTVTNFLDKQITGAISNIKAIVVNSLTGSEADTPNLKTLYVKYINTGTNLSGNTFFTPGEGLVANTGGFTANVALSSSPVGIASSIELGEGIIFAKDHFIRVPAQEIIVGRYSTNASFKIGLDLTETIVTSSNDSTLLDPAEGSYNYAAPGANRLKLTGVLTKYALSANTGPDFVELFRLENGIIQSKTTKPAYSDIRDYLAQRTSDINGSFQVRGLNVRLREHLNQSNNQGVFSSGSGGDSTKLVVDVEPGKAYVQGYDIETIVTKHIPINKSTTFESLEGVTVSSNYGNYITVKEVAGVWDVNNHRTVTLFNAATRAVSNNTFSTASPAGSSIGTARVRNIEYDSGSAGAFNSTFKMYLYDVQMTSNTFSNVKSVFINNTAVSQANGVADVVGATASLNETDFNKAIFKVPANNIRRLRDTSGNIDTNFEFTKRFDITIATDGTFSLATGAIDETLPFSIGALNASQKRDNFYLSLNANTISSTNVAVGSMSSGANTITGLTSATTKFNVGDIIKFSGGYANTFTVTNVASTTLTTLQPANIAVTTQGIKKQFVKGQIIDMSGVGGDGASRTISVASSTGANFDIQETLTSSVSATVITNLTKVDGKEIAKAYNTGRFVQITVNNPSGTPNLSGPWNLGISDIDQIIEVRRNTSNTLFTTSTQGVDVTSSFTLDNGQTDNLYKHGKLKLKSTPFFTPAAGDVYLVKLNYFTHDTSQGVGYFSVDSYPIDDNNVANTIAITTQEIPLYTSVTDGAVFPLRDSIDIRPRITDTATNTTTVSSATVNPAEGSTIQSPAGGLRFMGPNKNLTADLDFYLARKDVVSLSPTGEFRVTSGRPSLNPLYPEEPSGHLPIAKVNIPPFPSLSQEVGRQFNRPDLAASIQPVRTERYTMKDIGSLRDRVDRIEYYTRLSLLEQYAKNLNFADSSGNNRFKNGIIVDTFTGHNIGNVYNPDYKAAVDRFNGELRPQFRLNNIGLNFQSSNSTNIIIRPRDAVITVGGSAIYTVGETVTAGAASGKLVYQVGRKLYLENVSGSFAISTSAVGGTSSSSGTISAVSTPQNGKYATLPYQHRKVVTQPFATTTRNAAGVYWNFLGDVTLSPDQDYWLDTTTPADVQINFESNFDNWTGTTNPWETEWNNWESLWTGVNVLNSTDSRTGTVYSGVQQFGLFQNENVVEVSERQTRTGIRAGIFPETQSERTGPRVVDTNIIPFMRSRIVQVTGRGFKPNTRLYAFFDSTDVTSFITPTNSSFVETSNEGSNLVSNNSGDVFCTFRIPADQSLRFRVGERKFRLTDNPTNASGVGFVTTSGEGIYSARGLTQTVQDTIVSTRVPVTRQEAVTEDRLLSSTRRDREGVISQRFEGSVDPIAQTFRVNDYTSLSSVSGVFLTKIDLFFASKDATRPVFVEIREVDPSTSYVTNKVIPFSAVTLEAAEINTSNNGSSATPVIFTTPIHLLDGKDYAIVIKPAASNPNVSLFVSRIGEDDLITSQRVSEQPAVGVLFVPSNNRTWTAVEEEDLKFNLYVANFDTTLTGSAVFKNQDVDFFKVTGSNTFNRIGEPVTGHTTLINTSTMSVNVNMVLVGNTSSANGRVVSQSSNTIIIKDESLANKFTVGERANVVINGVKQTQFVKIHSVSKPTGKVAYFDNVNYSSSNTVLHLSDVTGSFNIGEQLKGQINGQTAIIGSIDKQEVDTLHLNASYISFEGTSLTASARLNTSSAARDSVFRLIEDNENTHFSIPKYILSKTLEGTNISGQKSGEIKFEITSSDNRLAPVIDIERVNAIVVTDKINNAANTAGELEPTGGQGEFRYITRTLALADEQDAEDIVVRLSAYQPLTSNIDVYYKILNKDDSDAFNDRNYVLMRQLTPSSIYSDSEDTTDFKIYDYGIFSANLTGAGGAVQYTNSEGVTFTGFKYFAIKIVMRTSLNGALPKVRDLMAIALQI